MSALATVRLCIRSIATEYRWVASSGELMLERPAGVARLTRGIGNGAGSGDTGSAGTPAFANAARSCFSSTLTRVQSTATLPISSSISRDPPIDQPWGLFAPVFAFLGRLADRHRIGGQHLELHPAIGAD